MKTNHVSHKSEETDLFLLILRFSSYFFEVLPQKMTDRIGLKKRVTREGSPIALKIDLQ
jgi:hypothetical protein